MVIRTNPSLGPNIEQVIPAAAGGSWYDGEIHTYASTQPNLASPQLGDTCFGDDGRLRMWVQASGTIADAAAPGTQIAITVTGEDNVTAATGSGGWYAPPTTVYGTDLLAGDRFWATKGTAP